MKTFYFTIVFLFSVSVSSFANDPLKVCTKFTFSSSKNDCISLVLSDYFQEEASMFCSELTFDSNKLDCLKAVKRKVYSETNLELCNQNSFDTQKIDCLLASGRAYGPNDQALDKVLVLAKEAKIALYERDIYLVLENLNELIELLTKE